MPDRRRDRQKRVRQEAGSTTTTPVAVESDKPPEPAVPEWRRQTTPIVKQETTNSPGIAYKEKQYEKVHIPTMEPAPESTQKYRRREVLSNWSRYDDLPPDQDDETIIEGIDYMVGEDFSTILQQYSGGSATHMKLKGETLWDDTENNILAAHGLGALRINDIVSAINTLPLHIQCCIPEDQLPKQSIEFYNQLAEDNRKMYIPTEMKDLEVNEKLLESLRLGDTQVPHINMNGNVPDISRKILESLKINEDDPLALEEEVISENTNLKSAVDVALTLSSAFEPEPEDVDLDDLIRERTPEKQETPEPEVVKTPSKEASRRTTPASSKEATPVPSGPPQREVNKSRGPSQEKDISKKSNDNQSMNFGLSKSSNPGDQKSNTGFNFGLPKADSNASPGKTPEKSVSLKDMAGAHLSVEPPKLLLDDNKVLEDDKPVIDLDAPQEEPSKPVVLVNKDETDDLEDWLDSILD